MIQSSSGGVRYLHDASAEPLVPAIQKTDNSGSSKNFEDFLSDVEHSVRDAGQLLLFSGDQLRLEIRLLRNEKNPRLVWGLKHHEDWAFKATILRFARGSEPVHLILSTENGSDFQTRGWVVHRTTDAFWASPLPAEHAQQFWEHCLVSRLD
jgi:hypothetical protein